jgi:hypothetical protein
MARCFTVWRELSSQRLATQPAEKIKSAPAYAASALFETAKIPVPYGLIVTW